MHRLPLCSVLQLKLYGAKGWLGPDAPFTMTALHGCLDGPPSLEKEIKVHRSDFGMRCRLMIDEEFLLNQIRRLEEWIARKLQAKSRTFSFRFWTKSHQRQQTCFDDELMREGGITRVACGDRWVFGIDIGGLSLLMSCSMGAV